MTKFYIDVMKDHFGNLLALGDTVAFYAPSYRNMVSGEIIAFTAKQVRVKFFDHSGYERTYLNYPNNFVKKVNA